MITRLQHMTEKNWLAMGDKASESKRALLHENSISRESWRQSAYGYMWEVLKIKRQPTASELADYEAKIGPMKDISTDATK